MGLCIQKEPYKTDYILQKKPTKEPYTLDGFMYSKRAL